MQRISWWRVFAASVLSVLMVPISWGATLFSSAGFFLAHTLLRDHASWASNKGFETAAVIDFTLWFAFFWGISGLWIQVRKSLDDRVVIKKWIGTLLHAALCAIPLSFYSLLAAMLLANNRKMPDSATGWIFSLTVSLAACTLFTYGLFALATRFWSASWILKKREKSRVTTLDIH